ncbi:Alpha/beta hydrolase family protein [Micromonospora rhizosphaerae]|uniref:Alpha/beta hydrolase family protein n=1 Tax=Micromonospora rhizosphaerae TaxID=568872 RepID=A0A1C6SYT8_9ACTN|nr:alpha/beta hydrolase [Micromonospora rhizosphaerae]SCL34529.1 Alpha/beta hydrolase family protein [Micromonospora rhizosphaerae]
MTNQRPTVVLVHGAFAESASWSGLVERLQDRSIDVVAVANPLRSVPGDAAYLSDVIAGVGGPVVLVGHSYGGMVITDAAAGSDKVAGLVYVCAFAPDQGESAFDLANKFPGSTSAVRPHREAADGRPGVEVDPVVVRLQRRVHPGRPALLHGEPGRRQGRPRGARRVVSALRSRRWWLPSSAEDGADGRSKRDPGIERRRAAR